MSARRAAVMTALLALLVLLSGCTMATLQDVPLPSTVHGSTYRLNAVFKNVLGLPEQAPVKMSGTTIGEVDSIESVDYTARVVLKISKEFTVPADVHAEIALSSPMGSAFVQLTAPSGTAASALAPGATVPISATSQAPTVSDLLSAASTLLTGGDFADIKVIMNELNTVMHGNAGDIQTLIARSNGMLTRLNQHTAQFDQALTSLQALSTDLAHDRALLGRSIAGLAPAIKTLSAERHQIFALMDQLRRLSTTATGTLTQTRSNMLSVLADLGPILEALTRNQAHFRDTLAGIEHFAAATKSTSWGNYLNFNLTTLIDQTTLTSLQGTATSPPPVSNPIPGLPGLPTLPGGNP